MANYFDMGGYAGFIWPSYAIAAIVMGVLFIATWRGLKSRERTLEMLLASRGPRRPRRGAAAPVEPAGRNDVTANEETG